MQLPTMTRSLLFFAGLLLFVFPSSVVGSPVRNNDLSVSVPRSSSHYLLTVRADPKQSGDPNCGVFNTADKKNFEKLQYDMSSNKGTSTTPARTCRRHACWNTSGIYVCNDNDHDVDIPYLTIRAFAATVGSKCCTKSYTESKGISGQEFSDQHWNVIVAYANCNHDKDRDRPSYGPVGDPWGPNGECQN